MYSHPLVSKPASSPVPALLRNGHFSRGMFGRKPSRQKLLVPVDGSAESMCAVEHVIEQVSRSDAQVHLINVQPPIMAGDVNYFMSAKMVFEMRRDAGERALRGAKRLLDANHVQHTAEVIFGKPAEAIARCAVERRCTKIVMGTKGRSLIANLVARSVASRVVRRAHVPVTLVKDAPRADQPLAARSVRHAEVTESHGRVDIHPWLDTAIPGMRARRIGRRRWLPAGRIPDSAAQAA
jgi:nucleotide-binding universal stress UspA family protein